MDWKGHGGVSYFNCIIMRAKQSKHIINKNSPFFSFVVPKTKTEKVGWNCYPTKP